MERLTATFRAAASDGGRVVGHASVFNQVARIGNQGYEQIAPEAFNRALSEEHDVVLLVNHDGLPLARTTSGTLRLGVDADGLTVDADMADTTLGRDVRLLLARGDLGKMSFGFIPTADRYDTVEGQQVRTITDLDLFDVSIVNEPAYAGTDVSLRHLVPTSEIRKSGLSNRAKAILARTRALALQAQNR